MTQKVWVFDLDDTLHDASSHIFPVMNRAMTEYIMAHLSLDEEAAFKLRQHYWQIYGATLKGLMRHHQVNPHHFLKVTHDDQQLAEMAQQIKGLRHLINQLKGRKVVFTNAPKRYALAVLNTLGITDLFAHIFTVESSGFHPKPSIRGFRQMLNTIGAKPSDCTMLEDSAETLMTAKRLGMRTVYVSRRLHKPSYVDFRITHINQLYRSMN